MESIISTVWSTIKRYQLFRPKEKIVLGVSGGPDSVALLLLLNQINQRYRPSWRLIVAHLNHQLRGGAALRDERFVKALAKRLRLGCHIEKSPIRQLVEKGNSLEAVAREARYAFLARVARAVGARTIAVGHTLDDQVETVLMRLIRGCGLRGLSGILPKRRIFHGSALNLVRPLINLKHNELIDYLKTQQQRYRIDATNLSLRTGLRNRIRLAMFPYLEGYNPRIKENLFQVAQIAQTTQRYLETEAKKWCPVKGNLISLKYFSKIPQALKVPVLELIIKRVKGNLKRITSYHYQTVCDLADEVAAKKSIAHNEKRLDLPDNLRVKIGDGLIRFSRATSDIRRDLPSSLRIPEEITVPGKTRSLKYRIEIETKILTYKKGYLSHFKATKSNYEEVFNRAKIRLPLILRCRQPGDKFQPLGTRGGQSIKKFFIDHKVPKEKRDELPLIVSDNKIIWVVGYRIEEKVKVNRQTSQILKIKVRKF